ncbi:MAG TPA: hypothetical protein VNG04_04290 [Candidatus Acidoferrum sp.]|nr:hypothetical protein [Candidatus Acidoferrum sp.]
MIPEPPLAPEPARRSGLSRSLRTTISALILIVIVVVGIIGYAAAGLAYAQTQVGSADRALNTVISHQNTLNSTFKDIDSKFTGLGTNSTFDPKQARALVDQFVASATAAGTTVDQDDTSLVLARAGLSQQEWLTALARGNLDKEAARIDHARKALSRAKIVAADYVLDGQFLQAFLDTAAALEMLGAQSANADLAGAKTTLATMRTTADKALQLSTGPGLPSELHALMGDFESLITDFGKLLDAAAAGDDTAITSAETSVQSDAGKISGYDFTTISTEIDAFYKPLVDGFNAEMAKATA